MYVRYLSMSATRSIGKTLPAAHEPNENPSVNDPTIKLTPPSVASTILLVLAVAPFMAGLLGLYAFLSIGMPYFGFLFLLYWAGILHQSAHAFFPSFLGGASGILLGLALVKLPQMGTVWGPALAAVLLAIVLFCFMRAHLSLLLNNATMLFLIVSTIPELHVTSTFGTMIASLTVGAAYMGTISLAIRWFGKRSARKQGASADPGT